MRKCFKGKPEHIENFLRFVAGEVREILARLGLRSIDEAVGRSDLLETNEAINFWKSKNLDFSKIFEVVGDESLPRKSAGLAPRELQQSYDKKLIKLVGENVESGKPAEISMEIKNSDRSVGAMLSSMVAKKYGNAGLPEDTIKVNFKGVAGQSFGAFLAAGLTFNLEGEANDYVGKGLSGGKIIVRLSPDCPIESSSNWIAGNVIGYGATGGKIFLNGKAGERFAIRNSGATLVAEGIGDHCCEYMTGETGNFDMRCNLSSIDLETIAEGSEDENELKGLIEEFYEATSSTRAREILDDWENMLPKFVKVFPVEYKKALGRMHSGDSHEAGKETV